MDVLVTAQGPLGRITLNRPAALNAVDRGMCAAIHAALDRFAADPAIAAVAIDGAGGRAFCAGGDVVAMRAAGLADDPAWEAFFATEYRMNLAVARFPKPYLALMDGVTMGGGVGLSIHGSHRIATERTLWAMPETGIGMIPDVGSTHALPRLPGRLGLFLALTGARLDGAECLAAGIATHFVPSAALPALLDALAAGEPPDAALARLATEPGPARLSANRAAIDRLFAGWDVPAILARLDADRSEWASKEAATIRRMSPTALVLAAELLRLGEADDLAAALAREYRVVAHLKHGADFHEGVRAQLIDKDRAPRWRPPTLGDIDPGLAPRHLSLPLGGDLALAPVATSSH